MNITICLNFNFFDKMNLIQYYINDQTKYNCNNNIKIIYYLINKYII